MDSFTLHTQTWHARLNALFERQRQHQYTVARTTARERKAKLRALHAALIRNRKAIRDAMWADFRKSPMETDVTEIAATTGEIRHALRHLSSWMAPRRVGVRLPLIGSTAWIHYEPKGVCLIVAPWNYPFNLSLIPLVSAVAAGNCAILKPSEHAPNSARVIKAIVGECFAEEEAAVIEGDVEVAQALLELPFDHIFFTGSPAVGKIVMAAAAKRLASVTLELGGKSPVVVDESADVDRAASRIAWMKGMNAGQICIAPDYVLAHESVHEALVERLEHYFKRYYGATPEARQQSPDYPRLIHDRHFSFIKGLLDDAVQRGATVRFGGRAVAEERYIEPTVLTRVPDGAAIWDAEIFGPLLPIRPYQTLPEAIGYINAHPKPLALYVFSQKRDHWQHVLNETRSGGACINECGLQFINPNLPFGGQNHSGIGRYHGEWGFQEFSHARAVARQHSPWPTTNLFLPPYRSAFVKQAVNALIRWL
ncbi:MAG: aldehyde dehydrogenase family protein [Saprospiraceae bacterium]|nr:aldehyde dehydrogenase family protein [Saprospiraceae bacterium]MDW8228416.1 aldehyde dehydrogenase family protein [Saprospiraceae bacterium]